METENPLKELLSRQIPTSLTIEQVDFLLARANGAQANDISNSKSIRAQLNTLRSHSLDNYFSLFIYAIQTGQILPSQVIPKGFE